MRTHVVSGDHGKIHSQTRMAEGPGLGFTDSIHGTRPSSVKTPVGVECQLNRTKDSGDKEIKRAEIREADLRMDSTIIFKSWQNTQKYTIFTILSIKFSSITYIHVVIQLSLSSIHRTVFILQN